MRSTFVVALGFAECTANSHMEATSLLMTHGRDDITVGTKEAPTPFRWFPVWFEEQVAQMKQEAVDIVAVGASCNKHTPSDALPEAARHAHRTCRVEQLAMLGLNSGEDCEESKKKDCDGFQSQFEQIMCAHGESCKETETCHKGVADDMTRLKKQEAAKKELFVKMTKEDCVLQHWHGTDAEKAACAVLEPDTSHVSITYASEPDIACTHPRVIPGSPGWITEEYSHHNWSHLAVAVIPCSGSSRHETVHNVCIDALGDKPANFSLPEDMSVGEVIFTHKSGAVSCSGVGGLSNFGCFESLMGLVIVKEGNKDVLMPLGSQDIEGFSKHTRRHAHWYKLQGVGRKTVKMHWKFGIQPTLSAGNFEVWYNEDLSNRGENGNIGTACYDIEFLGSTHR